MDVARSELVEKELDDMIGLRFRRTDPDEESKLWKESVGRYNERWREKIRRGGSSRARAVEYDKRAALLGERGEGTR